MKVGILTFHNGYNYGAFAQVFALQECIRSLGYEVKIIHYKNLRFTLGEYRHFLIRKSVFEILSNLIKIRNFKRDFRSLALSSRTYELGKENREYDVVVFGSDSIWNYTNPLNPMDMGYFGVGVDADKIAYAVSMGPDGYDSDLPTPLLDSVCSFKAIGARDENTLDFSRKAGVKAPLEIVLDPTFLYDFASRTARKREPEKYLLVYGYQFTQEHREATRQLAQKMGWELVSVGYENSWCERSMPTVSPFEWLEWIKGAEMVMTSMYHGTLLSIQMEKPFWSFVSPYRRKKISHILNLLKLEDRMVEENEPKEFLLERLSDPIEWDTLRDRKKRLVLQSMNFLRNSLINAF